MIFHTKQTTSGRKLQSARKLYKKLRNNQQVVRKSATITRCVEDHEDEKPANEDEAAVIQKDLVNAGFRCFLRGILGGLNTESNADIIIMRMVLMIQWTRQIHSVAVSTIDWLKELIKNKYIRVSDYADYMLDVRLRAPATIKVVMLNVKKLCTWFVTYRVGLPTCKPKYLIPMIDLLSSLSTKFRQMLKHDRSAVTVNTLISANKMPQNGMADLRGAVIQGIEWVEANQGVIVLADDKVVYETFLAVLICGLYVTAPQGRVGGLQSLTIDQIDELTSKGYALTNQFKTQSTFGYQAVVVATSMHKFVDIYMTARSAVMERTGSTSSFLWVTFSGQRDQDLGRRVTTFFKQRLRLHITTTMIRSLIEMEVDAARKQGKVTTDAQSALQALSGHGSKVVKDYYLKANVHRNVIEGTRALESAVDGPAFAGGTDHQWVIQSATGLYDGLHQEPWGSAHPDRHEDTPNHQQRRAHWSNEEILYIANWHTNAVRDLPTNLNNFASRCLAAVRNDPQARPIFHELHVLDSSRMRTGVDKFKAMERLGCITLAT
jgi:hypothetical protein